MQTAVPAVPLTPFISHVGSREPAGLSSETPHGFLRSLGGGGGPVTRRHVLRSVGALGSSPTSLQQVLAASPF